MENQAKLEIQETLSKDKMNWIQGIIYKLRAIRKIIFSKRFVLIGVEFSEDFRDMDLDIKRYKVSNYGVSEICNEVSNSMKKYFEDTELVEKI